MKDSELIINSRQYIFRFTIIAAILTCIYCAYTMLAASWAYSSLVPEGIIGSVIWVLIALFLGYRFTKITSRRFYTNHFEIYNLAGQCILNIAYNDIDGWFYKQSKDKYRKIYTLAIVIRVQGKRYNFSKISFTFLKLESLLKSFSKEDLNLKNEYRAARIKAASKVVRTVIALWISTIFFAAWYHPQPPADELLTHKICGTIAGEPYITVSGKKKDQQHFYFSLHEYPGKQFGVHNNKLIQELIRNVKQNDSVCMHLTESDYNIHITKLKPPAYWDRIRDTKKISPASLSNSHKEYFSYSLESVYQNKHDNMWMYIVSTMICFVLVFYRYNLLKPNVEK